MNKMKPSLIALVATIAAGATFDQASAFQSICSNPKRAGVKAGATLDLQWADMPTFKKWLQAASYKSVGMSYASVASGSVGKPDTSITFILQSPKSSVAINIMEFSSSSTSKVTLERTCISDNLEPWPPYWRRFLTAMKSHGYRVTEKSSLR